MLDDNMIAVYYDEEANVWRKADSKNKRYHYKWYDYDNKMWANSVTVSSANRSTYLNANPGTEISMDDILTMQVWIPRYKYKVWNYNSDGTVKSSPQEIEIVFENGAKSTGDIECTDTISGTDGAKSESCKINNTECTDSTCNNKYYTHPAFTFGEEELEGFWIGKFEVSSNIECVPVNYDTVGNGCNLKSIKPLVKPDVVSWQGVQIGTFDYVIRNMNSISNVYGFTNSIDIHMIKNMEWGAVSYLSHSKYGTCDNDNCTTVYKNNSSGCFTGRSGKAVNSSSTLEGDYRYNEIGLGTNSSTTGNIYGVYDMSGGGLEYVMGNMISKNANDMMSGNSVSANSGYSGIIYNAGKFTKYTGDYDYPDSKYYDKYSFGTESTENLKKNKLGDGIKEMSNGWYENKNYTVTDQNPWFPRGNLATGIGGIFSSGNTNGYARPAYTSRLIITP